MCLFSVYPLRYFPQGLKKDRPSAAQTHFSLRQQTGASQKVYVFIQRLSPQIPPQGLKKLARDVCKTIHDLL